ncbi:VWA domain-containing protein [uncultured Vagococcus sp.]|uniref:vWA domain-containing protein n=1 Tax=uncultured Vagococcus sp. TaxID=189676 RepID=UPI0028D2C570|nr:VWA domain-containing protein [uncultured Vagococcus sp.]
MKKWKLTTLVVTSLVLAVSLVGCTSKDSKIENSSNDIKTLSKSDAKSELNSYTKKIDPSTAELKRDIDSSSIDDKAELPPIDKTYPLSVEGTNQINAEIFVSPEKAGSGKDGLFNELAEAFNSKNNKIDGKTISISVRSMASGTGLDYINTGNYIPDAYTPSNQLWGKMLESSGVGITTVAERTIGNTGGLLMKESTYKEIETKYNEVNIDALVKSVTEDELLLGYTNPYTSSTGLSLLTQLMSHFDKGNPLSDQAVASLQNFQKELPSTLYNTLQLREVAKNGSVDIMSISYQTYINTPEFKQYKYVPIGMRQDSPMYTLNSANEEKKQVISQFTQFIAEQANQDKASSYGFNQLEDYQFELGDIDGSTITAIQKLWKENKNGGKPIIAVFVADVSGSMDGAPINALRQSLLNSGKYIGDDAYVGLVSYSSDVTIELPIDRMTAKQRSYFTGAIKNLTADGGTATYDGTLVALKMIQEQLAITPDARPVIFVLSDGETNQGYKFEKVAPIIKALGVSINTIGYNAQLEELRKLSNINESATINADSDDVVYQLKQLFNAEL